jgi:hypothetical protein
MLYKIHELKEGIFIKKVRDVDNNHISEKGINNFKNNSCARTKR